MANDIVAHRGWSAAAPENTIVAFRKALEAPYVAGLELDIQLSKDGVPVVIHDFTLERTTTGRGYVKDHTLEELKALDAGAWFGPEFRGERIPTLAEALALAKGRAYINIELKTAGGLYPGLAEAAVKVVREAGMENEVYFTSFDHLVMLEAKSIAPDIRTGLLVLGRPVAMKSQFEATGADVLSIAYPYISKDLVQEAEELGIDLLAWTVDDPARIRELAALSDRIAICTNAPDAAREALGV